MNAKSIHEGFFTYFLRNILESRTIVLSSKGAEDNALCNRVISVKSTVEIAVNEADKVLKTVYTSF